MKKIVFGLMMVVLASVSVSAQAAVFMGNTRFDGATLACDVPGPAWGVAHVAAIRYNFQCMDVYGRVFNYSQLIPYNNITSNVMAGTFKTFIGPNAYGCNMIASSCTVRTLD